MKYFPISIIFLAFLCSSVYAAAPYREEVTVLNETTFLKTGVINNGFETIQLFKIENDKIVLVDAIQIQEKTVNFKPLLEYVRLKIERKSSL